MTLMGKCFVCGFLVILFGFGVSVIILFQENEKVLPSNQACGLSPLNITHFSLQKQFFEQLHWKYSVTEFNGEVQLKCPTQEYDTAVYLQGTLAGYIDGKVFSTVSKSYIRDCHGRVTYVVRTDSFLSTLTNMNGIKVSYLIRDASDKIDLAYVAGTHFFSDNIEIKGNNGEIIAIMKRGILAYKWDISIYKPSHPAASVLVLSLIAGKRSFADSFDAQGNQTTNGCNQYFWGVVWTIIGVLMLGAITGFGYLMVRMYQLFSRM